MHARSLISCLVCGAAACLVACGRSDEPPVIEAITVSIDAANNCTLESKPVECAQVANVIHERYPTSKPRVDICLQKETRYEAATEVMQSVSAAGFTVGNFDCGKTTVGG